MSEDTHSKSRTLFSIVARLCDWSLMLLGPLRARYGEAESKRATTDAEHDVSHTTAKAGPVSVKASSGVAKEDPDGSAGSWNQTVGSDKDALGGPVGAGAAR
ncbi:hypothetical protein PMIN04_007213 [Paraphaeosphaeria minitans]